MTEMTEMTQADLRETTAGKIVVKPGCDLKSRTNCGPIRPPSYARWCLTTAVTISVTIKAPVSVKTPAPSLSGSPLSSVSADQLATAYETTGSGGVQASGSCDHQWMAAVIILAG